MGKFWLVGCVGVAALAVFWALQGNTLGSITLTEKDNFLNASAWWKIVSTFGNSDEECSCAEKDDEGGVGSCKLKGTVNDCCCDYATVNHLNQHHLHPLVNELVQKPFFRYFKVNLWCDCPLWPDDGMCALEACSVCECEDGEVPKVWTMEENNVKVPSCNPGTVENESTVDRTVDPSIKSTLVNLPGWRGFNNPWMAEDESDVDYSYINLLVNPERYTGYKGDNAQRVWMAIYSQSCFSGSSDPGEDACTERRIFYRLISGLHSSITAHIAKEYLVDEENGIWGPNLDLFEWKLGKPEFKSRVENLYFSFLFVLRAVMKAGPLLEEVGFSTGLSQEDAETLEIVQKLVHHPVLQSACPVPFDEGRLWKGDQGPELRQQLQASFQNITRIMDCVGCEKCKLWGKLQTLGLATALKVLFHEHDCGPDTADFGNPNLILERNEVIALINLLERLSQSIETYRVMSGMLDEKYSKMEDATPPTV